MAPHHQALIVLAGFLVLITLRVPVAIALVAAGLCGTAILIGLGPALALLSRAPMELAASWELSAVPMFLLMGTIVSKSGMADSLFTFFRVIFARVPGGLAVATNFACAGFGAASGSSLAATAGIGRLAVPHMRRAGYQQGLIGAVCGCGGTLAALIPPSIPFIVFALLTEQSALVLFIAGLIPGILTALVYAAMIILRCLFNPELDGRHIAQAKSDEVETLLAAFLSLWPIALVSIAVIVGLYGGFATPTEAGGLGACAALAVAVARRSMSLQLFWEAVSETAVTSAAILIIAVGASVLTAYLTFAGFPVYVSEVLNVFGDETWALLLTLSITFVLLGMFLDPLGVMLLATPIFLPTIQEHGFDLVWFAVIVVKYIEIGLITPPVGLNLFAARGLLPPNYPFSRLIRATMWFLAAEGVVMIVLLGFPEVSLWLPNLMH
ncbi:MAG: TRAP transporter large permease [Pseudomonadota bacterium]